MTRFEPFNALPGAVDAEKILAQARNGILVIGLPKRARRSRSIQVKVNA